MDQELLQRTSCDGERDESLTTTKTPWERNRGESSDENNAPTSRTKRASTEKPWKEDNKTSSVDYQLRARKPSDPKPSNKNTDRNTTNQKRGEYQSTSSSDSEGQEENEKIIRFQRKRSSLEEEESTMTRLQSNGADWNLRSVTRKYEDDNKTCRSLTEEEKISHAGRSNDLDKLAGKNREIAEGDKDFIPRNRHWVKEDKSHTNSGSSDSDGERSAHEGKGGVKPQDTLADYTNRKQRSRSRSAESDRNPSSEKNRKSRHHHRHHRHRGHHHRHHRNRSSTPSENRAEKHKQR